MSTKHLDNLGAAIRNMEQRQHAVRYERSALWAEDAAMRAKLALLETVVAAIRQPNGDMYVRFADGSCGRGATVWEALGPDCPRYAKWMRAAYTYYRGDGRTPMSDHQWDAMAREFAPRKDEFYELRGTEWEGGSLFWLKFPDWAKKCK